jgi:hypothetical protein
MGAQLSIRGPLSGAPVIGDRRRLQAAFSALLKAMLRERPSAETVVVETRVTGRPALAVVIVGEPSEVEGAYDAPREIFDETRGGLGLALPIARRVVERAGGDVWTAAPPARARARGALVVALPCAPDG